MKFPECSKDGFHLGENMNQICLQKKCKANSIGCVACLEETHKSHTARPIKMVVQALLQRANQAPDDSTEREELLFLVESSRNIFSSVLREMIEFWTSRVQVIES